MTNALEAAHTYVKRGWQCVPLYGVKDGACACPTGAACPSAGKHPHGRGGRWNVLSGGADVQAWYDDNPADNLGIVTGPKSGIFIFDVDPEHGGMDSLQQVVREYGAMTPTRIIETGSVGLHYYYRHPSNFVVYNSTNYIAKGIDIRGEGGQVVAPPSVSNKGGYRVLADLEVADAPEWLLRLLSEHSAQKERGGTAEIRIAEHVDVELLPERVATLARQHVGMDEGRYKHFHALVAGCYEVGYTQGQAVTIAAPWCAAVGKFVGRVEQEVARTWGKLEAESQRANEWIDGLGDRPVKENEAWNTSLSAQTAADASSPTPQRSALATPIAPSSSTSPASGVAGASPSPSLSAATSTSAASSTETDLPDQPPSWAAHDLGPILDGTYQPETPSLFPRVDGPALLYPGRTHSFHGESESGKSLIAQAECARVLAAGGTAAIVDFESDAAAVVGRLLDMGATPEALRTRFTYRKPESDPSTQPREREAYSELLALKCDVLVIDGVTDALFVFGSGSNDMDEVTAFYRRFPRLVARRTGAAVILIDHVAKDADTRGRHAVGSQAKLNALDGAAYVVEVLEPLGRGMRGVVSMRVGKDRPGGVRPHAGTFRKGDRTQEAARVVVDSTGGDIQVSVTPPEGKMGAVLEDGRQLRPGWLTLTMERVSEVLEGAGESLSGRQVEASTKGKASAVRGAIKTLVDDGFVVIERVGKYDRYATSRPYRSVDDELSEDYLGWANNGWSTPGASQCVPGASQSEGTTSSQPIPPFRGWDEVEGRTSEQSASLDRDEVRDDTLVSCKGCFGPVPQFVADGFSGHCGSCARKAGLL